MVHRSGHKDSTGWLLARPRGKGCFRLGEYNCRAAQEVLGALLVRPIPNTLETFVLEQAHLESVKARLLAGLSLKLKKTQPSLKPLG